MWSRGLSAHFQTGLRLCRVMVNCGHVECRMVVVCCDNIGLVLLIHLGWEVIMYGGVYRTLCTSNPVFWFYFVEFFIYLSLSGVHTGFWVGGNSQIRHLECALACPPLLPPRNIRCSEIDFDTLHQEYPIWTPDYNVYVYMYMYMYMYVHL